MNEEQFDLLMGSRPFTREDAARADTQLRRRVTLAIGLWGRTSDDLRRQLLTPSPEIPSGFGLADLWELQQSMEQIEARLNDPRNVWLSGFASSSDTIFVDSQRFTI
jgi:hypothetical protein